MTALEESAAGAARTARPGRAAHPHGAWRTALARPLGRVAVAYLALLVVCSALAPVLAPYRPTATDLDHILSLPSGAHPLGTDALGRDVLSRLLYGGRTSLVDAALAVGVGMAVALAAGLLAGYFGGWLDRGFTWLVDVMLAIPVIVTLLAVLAVIGNSMSAAMIALGVLVAPGIARVVRGATLAVRNELYISAARVSGLPHRHIVVRHVLPRVAGPVLVQASLLAGGALLMDAGLSYLGLGARPPAPTWGNMISEAAGVIDRQPWLLVPPGVVLGLAILAFGLLGDVLRDTSAERTTRRLAPARPVPVTGRKVVEPTTALLSARNVTISVPGPDAPVRVVEGLDLDIGPGECVGLVGETGCGKTITARSVLGLLPPGAAVTAGSIRFDGVDLATASRATLTGLRGTRIAMVFQDPGTSLDPVVTAGRHVAELVRRHHGGSRARVRARTMELLRSVGFPEPEQVAGRYPHQLSGGMAQRVAIAMALAGEPRLLIADEPTTALDVTVQAGILGLLRDLQRDNDMAILLISHDLRIIATMCDRAYVMYAGHVVESGDVAGMFRNPAHPYTDGLLRSAPRRATPGEHLTAIPGTVPPPGSWPVGCHFAARCLLATDECRAAPVPVARLRPPRRTRCLHFDELSGGRA
ncbi:dipeptide/oligopeptide/nickel ABC transporter permease/ATP-binding protein [Actinocatenispora rupis]|uniref:Dipeptide/oligopeptide/nickel ABC transporter ATP-binding protein n=1 Tax=Actinocatenispora rupis TaxID=519421 RepID=A0A8J3J0D0_9ACTN|nr:dipeptide/oligopeptide/nickel ABC transporter permease/ATP-binding protein [Actinocatenispora rupis]GID12210.1 dipeptide/oligopeptide/nickel ABC transporter ATP-binding protein [Actinocatenispora rupis]